MNTIRELLNKAVQENHILSFKDSLTWDNRKCIIINFNNAVDYDYLLRVLTNIEYEDFRYNALTSIASITPK